MLAADPGLAGVGRAEHPVVAVERRAVLAAGGGVAGLDPVAGIAIVADQRRAGVAHAGRDLGGLGAGAGVVVVAVRVGAAAVRDRVVHAAGLRVAGVVGAHDAVVTVERDAVVHTLAGGRLAGLGAVADVAVVAIAQEVVADVLLDVAAVGRAEIVVVTVRVRVAATRDRRAAARAARARIRAGAGVAVTARGAVAGIGVRTHAGTGVAGAGGVALIGGRADDRIRTHADPTLAGIRLSAEVAVVAEIGRAHV